MYSNTSIHNLPTVMLSDIGPFPNTFVAVRVTMMSSEGGQEDEETLNKCLQVPPSHVSELVGKVTDPQLSPFRFE